MRNEGSDEVRELKKMLRQGDAFSDEFIVELIKDRIDRVDCRVNGWILDGAPLNMEQIELLKSNGMIPSLAITLEISDTLVMQRLEGRRFDPITGIHYYLNQEDQDVPNLTVLKRLVHDPADTKARLESRL